MAKKRSCLYFVGHRFSLNYWTKSRFISVFLPRFEGYIYETKDEICHKKVAKNLNDLTFKIQLFVFFLNKN